MTISSIDLIVFSFIGIYFTLTLYHFLVWAGRKKDLSNLAFALLALCFFMLSIATEISYYLRTDGMRVVANYIFSMAIACLLPFLGFAINIIPVKLKKPTILGSSVIVGVGVLAVVLFAFFGLKTVADIVFYGSLFLYILPANFANMRMFIRGKLYRDRKHTLFLLGFMILVVSLFVCVLFITYLDISLYSLLGILLFHTPFVLMMFIFAVAITDKFNREHSDLNELKTSLEEKVVERTRQLEHANLQKSQFIVNFAHETKTPLTLITNYLDEYVHTHKTGNDLQVVRHYTEKLKHDMINILDHEKLAHGQIFFNHERITNVSRLVETQTTFFGEPAKRKKIAIVPDITEGLCVKMDPAAMASVVNNLLDNAIKYSDPGGRVDVRLSREGGRVILAVSDDGPGIPPGEQATVFEPFYQLSHRKRNTQGIGMGLNIVKKIMEETRGTIRLESAPGRGATFFLAWDGLPPGEADNMVEEGGANGPPPEASGYQSTDPVDTERREGLPGVLLVDDNRDIVRFLRKKLGAEYNVYCALGGREALDVLQRAPKPDVIVSDIMMDGMDGYEFYDELSARRGWRSVPFIFLTALGSTEEKIKGIRKGAVDFISKPFHVDELTAKIKSLINVRKALTKENLARVKSRLHHHLNAVHGTGDRRAGGSRQELFERYGVSKRQVAIIALLESGLLRKEICARLDISINTLNTQIRRLFEKCRVHTKTELLNIFR